MMMMALIISHPLFGLPHTLDMLLFLLQLLMLQVNGRLVSERARQRLMLFIFLARARASERESD